MTNITQNDFTCITNDVNGNPRYVIHYLRIADTYDAAVTRARQLGGKRYHTRSYGGGIVFTTYNLRDLCERLNAPAPQPASKSTGGYCATIDGQSVPVWYNPLAWQKLGLQYSATGYGGRIPTEYMINYNGKWRRVYVHIYSNIGTCYILPWIVVNLSREGE